jgi:molecular chaperone GrpE (heat shock protein)
MNDELSPESPRGLIPPSSEEFTLGNSSLYRLFEAFVAMRERNERQHRLFEQTLTKARDAIQNGFNSFAADTQRAYQQLRQEIHGEKRVSLALFNELLDIGHDLAQIVAARPRIAAAGEEGEALERWMEAIEIMSRKVDAALERHGIHRYDAVVGSPYNPALHERVGSRAMEGMGPYRIAEQREHGYASQQPELILRRPKVIVSE